MKKLLTIFTILSLFLCITGCKKNNNKVFHNSYELAEQYFSNDAEVSDIKIKNVPKSPIEIGYFSQAGIELEVSYVDGSKQTYPLTEGLFPKEDLIEFKTPGDKYFDIVFKNKHIALKFTLVEPEVKVVFKVRFLDRFNNLVEEKLVDYLSSVKCSKESAFVNYEDNNAYYKFEGKYDKDLDYICFNTDIKPVYTKYLFYNSADGYKFFDDYNQAYVVSRTGSSGVYNMHSLVYLGRYNNFVLQTLDTIERTEYKNEKLSFSKNKNAKSDMSFKENILANLRDNVLPKAYKHTTDYVSNPFAEVIVQNSKLLNFDLSQTTSVNFTDGFLDVPSCVTTSFDGYGFSGLERNDGIITSNKSVFENNSDLYLGKYMQGGTNYDYQIASDYELGYYQAEYLCDLDVYLDVEYRYIESAEGYIVTIFIDSAKIAFAYDESTLRFDIRYSENNDFSSYSKVMSISDGLLGNTFYVFLQNEGE